jgi:putative ABC transport system ATP-binding protein
MLVLDTVRKVYDAPGRPVTALDGVSLKVRAGSFIALMGPSGSGKSTLLQIAAGLDRPISGRVVLAGQRLTGNETSLAMLRREHVGFVFQQMNLLPTLTVIQNVLLPMRLAGHRADVGHAVKVLERVGLGERIHHRPAELSGGQQQRAAIARALVSDPAVILADEPTGSLDTRSARAVLELLREAVDRHGQTVVMATHDPAAASYADSVLFLVDGRVAGWLRDPGVDAVAERLAHLGDEAGAYPAAGA